MTTGQIFLILLAMILFSTIYLTAYNNLFDQADLAYKGMYILNGQKITDKYFQEIESNLLGEIVLFDSLQAIYNGLSDTLTVSDIDYHINISTTPCTKTGADTTTVTPEFLRIDISIWAIPPDGDTLWIGMPQFPISKVFVDLYY
ncbi:MAG: hypothetical protein RAP70_05255 [Candidatus Celaenobacter antarcticus]|nr:hypothetical protein [Candidatus Celaenobacter antarcticus]